MPTQSRLQRVLPPYRFGSQQQASSYPSTSKWAWEILSPSGTWDGDGVDTWIDYRRQYSDVGRKLYCGAQRRLENIPNTPWSPLQQRNGENVKGYCGMLL